MRSVCTAFVVLLLVVLIVVIARRGLVDDIYSRFDYIEGQQEDMRQKVADFLYDDAIVVGNSIAGVVNDGNHDQWYLGNDSEGHVVNVFARFAMGVMDGSLRAVVVERTGTVWYQMDMSTLQSIDDLGGDFDVVLGTGYEWVIDVIKGP